ncbi:MAG TPA: hypothetical protein VIF62_18525 [Labilithrix sp.]|jgi:hypothetical protein
MLEILFLVWFCRKLSSIAKAKGRSGGWGGLGALFWIGGEIIGFIIGAVADAGPGGYVLALLCAAVGAGIAYAIVKSIGAGKAWDDYGMPATASPAYAPPPFDPANPYNAPRT